MHSPYVTIAFANRSANNWTDEVRLAFQAAFSAMATGYDRSQLYTSQQVRKASMKTNQWEKNQRDCVPVVRKL
eukprot:6211426-Pleurochrysis_carterae.AAC.1